MSTITSNVIELVSLVYFSNRHFKYVANMVSQRSSFPHFDFPRFCTVRTCKWKGSVKVDYSRSFLAYYGMIFPHCKPISVNKKKIIRKIIILFMTCLFLKRRAFAT
jgi:hypothetical protein